MYVPFIFYMPHRGCCEDKSSQAAAVGVVRSEVKEGDGRRPAEGHERSTTSTAAAWLLLSSQ
jgi:hypothetical protein